MHLRRNGTMSSPPVLVYYRFNSFGTSSNLTRKLKSLTHALKSMIHYPVDMLHLFNAVYKISLLASNYLAMEVSVSSLPALKFETFSFRTIYFSSPDRLSLCQRVRFFFFLICPPLNVPSPSRLSGDSSPRSEMDQVHRYIMIVVVQAAMQCVEHYQSGSEPLWPCLARSRLSERLYPLFLDLDEKISTFQILNALWRLAPWSHRVTILYDCNLRLGEMPSKPQEPLVTRNDRVTAFLGYSGA